GASLRPTECPTPCSQCCRRLPKPLRRRSQRPQPQLDSCPRSRKSQSGSTSSEGHTSTIAPGGMAGPSRGSRALLSETWIEQVPEPVAEEVGAEHDERNGNAGHCRQPPGVGKVVAPLGEHRAPRGLRRLNAQAEEGQRPRA